MWPQITYIVLMSMGLTGSIFLHGKERTDKYNFFIKLGSITITIIVLYCGGFWDKLLN